MEGKIRFSRSVLVVSLGGLGDFVSRWPLWQSLRHSLPRAEITYLGYPRHGRLLAAAGLCDRVVDFNGTPDAILELVPRRVDVTVAALGSRGLELLGSLMGRRAGSVVRIEPFPERGAGLSVRDHILGQIRARGLVEPGHVTLAMPAGIAPRVDAFWVKHRLAERKVIAVHPGSGGRGKNWPIERFERLSAELGERGFTVLVLSGEAEHGLREGGGDGSWGHGALFFSGDDLVSLAGALMRCRHYVGNDSGVSHLAALAGVPVTVVFGPTDPAVWAPAGEDVRVIRRPPPCSPCTRERMNRCADRECLTGITVEEVLGAVASVKNRRGSVFIRGGKNSIRE